MSYCAYKSIMGRLARIGTYCMSTGAGECLNEIIQLSAGRLVWVSANVPDGSACPRYPIKFDSTARRLVRSGEAYTCLGYVL